MRIYTLQDANDMLDDLEKLDYTYSIGKYDKLKEYDAIRRDMKTFFTKKGSFSHETESLNVKIDRDNCKFSFYTKRLGS